MYRFKPYYSAVSTVRSKRRPGLQGSATVNKGVIANINAGNKRIRKGSALCNN